MLRRWTESPTASLVIITTPDDAEPLVKRMRVRLSEIRKTMKGVEGFTQFGFLSTIFDWDDGEIKSRAIALERRVYGRHNIIATMQRMKGPGE